MRAAAPAAFRETDSASSDAWFIPAGPVPALPRRRTSRVGFGPGLARILLATLVAVLGLAPGCKFGRISESDGGDPKPGSDATEAAATPAEVAVAEETPFKDVRAVLDGYEPFLQDPRGDAQGDAKPSFDLVSAIAVSTKDGLLVRVSSAEAMTPTDFTDVRLWVEQHPNMLTVEAKPDHPQKICELTPVGGNESADVANCLHLSDAFDIRIPSDKLPKWLDRNQPYFVSGISTCCQDENREKPYDEIDGAQEVWVN